MSFVQNIIQICNYGAQGDFRFWHNSSIFELYSHLTSRKAEKPPVHGKYYKTLLSENGIESIQNFIMLTALWTKPPLTHESWMESWLLQNLSLSLSLYPLVSHWPIQSESSDKSVLACMEWFMRGAEQVLMQGCSSWKNKSEAYHFYSSPRLAHMACPPNVSLFPWQIVLGCWSSVIWYATD